MPKGISYQQFQQSQKRSNPSINNPASQKSQFKHPESTYIVSTHTAQFFSVQTIENALTQQKLNLAEQAKKVKEATQSRFTAIYQGLRNVSTQLHNRAELELSRLNEFDNHRAAVDNLRDASDFNHAKNIIASLTYLRAPRFPYSLYSDRDKIPVNKHQRSLLDAVVLNQRLTAKQKCSCFVRLGEMGYDRYIKANNQAFFHYMSELINSARDERDVLDIYHFVTNYASAQQQSIADNELRKVAKMAILKIELMSNHARSKKTMAQQETVSLFLGETPFSFFCTRADYAHIEDYIHGGNVDKAAKEIAYEEQKLTRELVRSHLL